MLDKYMTQPYQDLAWHKFLVGVIFDEWAVADKVYQFYKGTPLGDKMLAFMQDN
jgi:hypothetical protein